MKKCSKCKVEKELSEFCRNRSCKDGLDTWCRSCKREYRQSDAGRKSDAKYKRSPVGKAAKKKWWQSDVGKASSKKSSAKWNRTDVGRESNRKSSAKSYSIVRGYLRIVFSGMNRRCTDPEHKSYKWYGGCGIRVCFKSFDDFFDYVTNDLKIDPRGLTIDRIDNSGNYEKGNIRFVSQAENNRNKGTSS